MQAGMKCIAARWKTTTRRRRARSPRPRASRSRISARCKLVAAGRCIGVTRAAVRRPSIEVTAQPARTSRRDERAPRKPSPPVTTTEVPAVSPGHGRQRSARIAPCPRTSASSVSCSCRARMLQSRPTATVDTARTARRTGRAPSQSASAKPSGVGVPVVPIPYLPTTCGVPLCGDVVVATGSPDGGGFGRRRSGIPRAVTEPRATRDVASSSRLRTSSTVPKRVTSARSSGSSRSMAARRLGRSGPSPAIRSGSVTPRRRSAPYASRAAEGSCSGRTDRGTGCRCARPPGTLAYCCGVHARSGGTGRDGRSARRSAPATHSFTDSLKATSLGSTSRRSRGADRRGPRTSRCR